MKIENPATAAPFPMSVKANKDATENKSSGSIKSTVKIEKPAAQLNFQSQCLHKLTHGQWDNTCTIRVVPFCEGE